MECSSRLDVILDAIEYTVTAKKNIQAFQNKLNEIPVDKVRFLKTSDSSSSERDRVTLAIGIEDEKEIKKKFLVEMCFVSLIYPCEDRGIRQRNLDDGDVKDFTTLIWQMWDLGQLNKNKHLDEERLTNLTAKKIDLEDGNYRLSTLMFIYASVILKRQRKRKRESTASPSTFLFDLGSNVGTIDDMVFATQPNEEFSNVRFGEFSLLDIAVQGRTVGELIHDLNLEELFPRDCKERKLIGSGVHKELDLKYMPRKKIQICKDKHIYACVYFSRKQKQCVERHLYYNAKLKCQENPDKPGYQKIRQDLVTNLPHIKENEMIETEKIANLVRQNYLERN